MKYQDFKEMLDKMTFEEKCCYFRREYDMLGKNNKRKLMYDFILENYDDGELVCSGGDFDILIYLYKEFYECSRFDKKIDVNDIVGFKCVVDKSRGKGTKGFWLLDIYGKLKGLEGRVMCGGSRSHINDTRELLRKYVMEDITRFNMENRDEFIFNNPLCLGQVSIDHLYPFDFMVKDFEEIYKVNFMEMNKKRIEEISEIWKQYHSNYSLLRCMDKRDNSSKGNRLTREDKIKINFKIRHFKSEVVKEKMIKRMNFRCVWK